MTERLYYDDSFLREFDARVLACEPAGDRWEVVLDRTAFYPTSGGQPHDLGRLNDAMVLEVLDRDDDHVIHLTDQPLAGSVHGAIDWERRFDHMQQHTAQHILSAVFIERFDFPTVSFHLGRKISTIDIAAPSVAPRHIEEAERRANEIIFEDRTVRVHYGTAEELSARGIRKKVEREGVLRAIDIDGFDNQPCGGTHLSRTGQAGMLLIRKCDKQKQNWRIEFVAGFRALEVARADRNSLSQAAEQIGCGTQELPDLVRKILEDRKAEQGRNERLISRLVGFQAESLHSMARGKATHAAYPTLIVHAFDESAQYLRLLGAELAKQPRTIALLGSTQTGNVLFAASNDVTCDMQQILRDVLGRFGGKGGGSRTLAQGSIPSAHEIHRVLTEAADRLPN